MNKPLKHITLFLFVLISGSAQNKTGFNFDHTQFRVDSSSNLIEIYYQFNTEAFVEKDSTESSIVSIKIIFDVMNMATERTVFTDTLSSKYELIELRKNLGFRDLKGVYKLFLDEGSYNISILLLREKDSYLVFKTNEPIYVKPFAFTEPQISGIQLSNSITKADSSQVSSFIKNTIEVVPNPSSSYSSEYPLFQYYSEIYNVAKKNLTLTANLISSQKKLLYSVSKAVRSVNESIVHVDQINLLKYPTDIYTFQLVLSDSVANYAYASEKQFYFYNKNYTLQHSEEIRETSAKLSSNLFSFLSGEECDEIFDKSKYIATSREKNVYNQLTTTESKRDFLEQFWQKRSEVTQEGESASYKHYMQRVDEADIKFKGIRKSGSQTERGRVYITYGNPNRVETYPNESNLKPYEIWYFDNMEGGVIFIFGDLYGFGEYELLHSNKRGEIFDDTWQRKLYNY